MSEPHQISDETVTVISKRMRGPFKNLSIEQGRFIAIMGSSMICIFMVALNSTIIAPAMTIIATQLDAFSQQTWIATAFMLGMNAFQPLAGKFSDILGRRPLILFSIVFFFIGTIINATAPNITGLIAGRTIQGFGSGGIMSMVFVIVTDIAPRPQLPRMQSLLSVVYGLASVAGPLLGGVFVDYLSWRWDFWLNVILSGIALVVMALFLKETGQVSKSSIATKIRRIDWFGTLFAVGGICCLLLALSWGPTYGWGDPHSYGPFIGAGISFAILVAVEGWFAKEPIMPPALIMKPSVLMVYGYFICLGMSFMGTLYFGPILFQAVFGATSILSGVRLIPFIACLVLGAVGSGLLMKRVPYPKLYVVIGAASNIIGYGLFHTVNENSGWGKQAGFLTFCGFAFGLSQQNSILAAQMSAPREYIAIATTLCNFFMLFAASVGVAIYQTLFQTFLKTQLTHVDLKILAIAKQHGALNNYLFIRTMPVEAQGPIIRAYMQALNDVFIIPIVASGCSLFFAVFFANIRYGSAADQSTQQVDPEKQPPSVTDKTDLIQTQSTEGQRTESSL